MEITITVENAVAKAQRDVTLTTGMVGVQAHFIFDDAWDGLSKTAVFRRGGITRDVVMHGDTVPVPPEVLAAPTGRLQIGVYGANSDGTTVIPTTWAEGPSVSPGSKPSGDTSTDPGLPVWAQLQSMIGDLDDLTTDANDNLVAAINDVAGSSGGGSGSGAVSSVNGKTGAVELSAEDVHAMPDTTVIPTVTGASVGQTVKIAAVDDDGAPTALEPVDFPSSDEVVKEWEEFLRFTTDNAETIVFDFSSNGAETLESKKVKEFYLYSPSAEHTGGTATALINNRVKLTGLTDFGRATWGCLKFCLKVDSDALTLVYFGRDTDNHLSSASLSNAKVDENNGLLTPYINTKHASLKMNDVQNGIPFPSAPVDYIKTVVITLDSACGAGVEFIVYVR